jgi:hypothetical protein
MSTPTPVPKNSDADKTPPVGPISSTAAAFGISPRVDQLPVAKPTFEGEPREINPQNTIPVKSVKPSVTKVKNSRKQALKKRGGR